VKKRSSSLPQRACAHCGVAFVPSRPDQKYHENKCRFAARDRRNPRVSAIGDTLVVKLKDEHRAVLIREGKWIPVDGPTGS